MLSTQQRAFCRQYLRRTAQDKIAAAMLRRTLATMLHPHQLALLDDPSKKKIARTGRRAGKTTEAAAELVLAVTGVRESTAIYTALTRKNAKLIMLPELMRMNSRLKLGMRPDFTELAMYLPNGSRILLSGADNEASIEKFRGFKSVLNVLDESASFGAHIEPLITEVLEPTLIDYDGTQVMIGTPAAVPDGFFYTADTDASQGWSRHHWTVLDNPYVPNAAAWLAEKRKTMSEATFQREWMGQWVADLDALVYHYVAETNEWSGALPLSPAPWEYGLGIDIGYDPDPTALCTIAWNQYDPHFYEIATEIHVGLTPSQIAERVQALRRERQYSKIVADGAGLGKAIIAEWRQRYNIPVHPARDKHLKREHIQLLSGDLRTGLAKISKGSVLSHQMLHVTWDDDRKTVSDRYPNDAIDAWEYISMEAKHFASRIPPEPLVTPGSSAALELEAKRYEEKLIKEIEDRERRARRGRRR